MVGCIYQRRIISDIHTEIMSEFHRNMYIFTPTYLILS